MKVIYKAPGCAPEPRDIPNTLEELQATVGGYIETVTIATDAVIICNEEGRLQGLPHNCRIFGVDFVGPILIAGVDEDEFTDLDAGAMGALLQAQKAIQQLQHDNHVIKGFTVQQCLDVALIALHNEFHFGPKMTARFESAFLDTFMAYAQMCVDDAVDDPEIVYTKEKMDRALRAACGENIRPFEERYAIENLYFREKLKEKSHE